MKRVFVAVLFIGSALSGLSAFDNAKVADIIMKNWNLDSRDTVTVSTPVPSEYGNLLAATASIRNNPYPVYFTPDEKFYFWGDPTDATVDPDVARWQMINLKDVHAQGSAKAPVTIVEYFNFQCGHCDDAHKALNEQLYKTYTKDQVRLVSKHYPLDRQDWAETGAVAAECAGLQGEKHYWSMVDKLFETEGINASNLKTKSMEFAKEFKLNASKFESCFDNKATLEKVKGDKLEGTRAGVNSTPTFFINGRMKRGFRDFNDLKALIDDKLAEKKK